MLMGREISVVCGKTGNTLSCVLLSTDQIGLMMETEEMLMEGRKKK